MNPNALRAEIVRNGMTQGQVAERIGMSANTFSIKMRTNGFGLDEADKLIALLGIRDPAAIFFAEGYPEKLPKEEGGRE